MKIIKIITSTENSHIKEYSKFKKCDTKEMSEYVNKHGLHFNKKLCDFAINNMTKRDKAILIISKETIEALLKTYNILVVNNKDYDIVFVYHMAIADYWESSITDELHLAKYIKDVLDDTDGYEGIAFNRWYADMCIKDIYIDWDSML